MKYEMVLVNSWNIEQYGASVGMILMQNCTISLISNGFHYYWYIKHYSARVGDDFVTKKLT